MKSRLARKNRMVPSLSRTGRTRSTFTGVARVGSGAPARAGDFQAHSDASTQERARMRVRPDWVKWERWLMAQPLHVRRTLAAVASTTTNSEGALGEV